MVLRICCVFWCAGYSQNFPPSFLSPTFLALYCRTFLTFTLIRLSVAISEKSKTKSELRPLLKWLECANPLSFTCNEIMTVKKVPKNVLIRKYCICDKITSFWYTRVTALSPSTKNKLSNESTQEVRSGLMECSQLFVVIDFPISKNLFSLSKEHCCVFGDRDQSSH